MSITSDQHAARAERDAFRSALLALLPEGAKVTGEATDMQWVVATDGRLIAAISEARVLRDDATRHAFTAALLAAAGLVITAPDALAARPAGDRAKIDWTNDPITRSDIKKWQRALYDLRQTYYHPGIGMHPPYYRRCRSGYLRALRHLRLTGEHNPPLVTTATGQGSEADHA